MSNSDIYQFFLKTHGACRLCYLLKDHIWLFAMLLSLSEWFRSLVFGAQTDESQSAASSNDESEDSGTSALPEVDAWHRYFLLSLDGGGIRGLSSLFILEELMQKIGEVEREHDRNATHSFFPDEFLPPRGSTTPTDPSYAYRYLPCHYFDGIVGTSTGGLIAIMLGRLRMPVKDCIVEYKRFSGEVFGHPRRAHLRGRKRYLKFNPLKDKYHVGPLRNAIDRIVSERDPFPYGQTNAARTGKPTLELPKGLCQTMVWAIEGSSSREGWLFRSFQFPKRESFLQRDQHTQNYEIRVVACAATAAITYFKPTRYQDLIFYDGGVTANNPCQFAMEEVRDYVNEIYGPGADDKGYLGAAVSIGTGKVERRIPKPPKSWFGRYGEAAGWDKRRADNSSNIHREMIKFASKTREHLKGKGLPDDSPVHFKYARFTVGTHREPPNNHDPVVPEHAFADVEKMAHMSMDEWIPEPDPNATVTKLYEATRAWVSAGVIQRQLRELAECLVSNRRKRSQCDQLTSTHLQPLSTKSLRWYRYASAAHWLCTANDSCTTLHTLNAIKQHLRHEHKTEFEEGVNARREACNYEEPRGLHSSL